jgi:hypothetical protein
MLLHLESIKYRMIPPPTFQRGKMGNKAGLPNYQSMALCVCGQLEGNFVEVVFRCECKTKRLILRYLLTQPRKTPVPEIIDPVFAKTSQNGRFLLSEYERFGLVFTKTRVYKFGHCSLVGCIHGLGCGCMLPGTVDTVAL